MADDKKFNPLNPKQAAPAGSFAAKLAARQARAEGKDDTSALDVADLSDAEKAQLTKNSAVQKASDDFKFVPVAQATERVCIIADDSSSMSSEGRIADAREGITEFMKECIPNETAVKIHPINATPGESYYSSNKILDYSTNLPAHADAISTLRASGSTPLYSAIQANLPSSMPVNDERTIKPNRMIVFSDGEPDGQFNGLDTTIALAKQDGVVIDTCLISSAGSRTESNEYQIMKRLAEGTGGIFIVFEKGKCSFKHGFKYLTKGKRLLLTDASFKAKLEAGQV
jgi:Mg-chelatase subunit ChlD